MDDLIILILFNGSWSDENCYVDYQHHPFMCPKNVDFESFRKSVYSSLKKDESIEDLIFRYQFAPSLSPTIINDDSSLRVFILLNSRSNSYLDYPLCLSAIPKESENQGNIGVFVICFLNF